MSTCSSNLTSDTHEGTCSDMGTKGFYRFPTSFFHSFPQIPDPPRNFGPDSLTLQRNYFVKWLSWLAQGDAPHGVIFHCLLNRVKIQNQSVCRLFTAVTFFSWRYCKLHAMQKKYINKSQRAWLDSVVWFVLNTERINI